MLGSSVVSPTVGPPSRTWAPSRRVQRGRKVATSSAMSSVSVTKRQRWRLVWAVCTCLLASTAAQDAGSSVVPRQTPPSTREISRPFAVFRNSTKAGRAVGRDSQPLSTQSPPESPALGRSQSPRNSTADLEGTAAPVHMARFSRDPSKDSGLLETKSSGVLDLTTPSFGGGPAKMETSLASPSKGLSGSTDALSVPQPVEKEKPGLIYTTGAFPTFSPASPHLPDARSSSPLDAKPALQIALSRPPRSTTLHPPSSAAQPTAVTLSPSAKSPAPGGQERPRTSRPVTGAGHPTLLDQKSPSRSRDGLPSAETGFLGSQAVKEASISPRMLGTHLSRSPLPTSMVPSEARPTDVFYPSSGVTAHRFSESMLPVSPGMRTASPATEPSVTSSGNTALLQEAVLYGQGLGGTELVLRDSSLATAVPTTLSRSSRRPSPSHSPEAVRAPLPNFVTLMDSSETKGLGTHKLSWRGVSPTNMESPVSDSGPALSVATDEARVTAQSDMGSPLSITPGTEELGTPPGVREGAVRDWTTVPARTGSQTPSRSSALQDTPGSVAPSGFPLRNASLLVSRIPGSNVPSSPHVTNSTANREEMGTTARSSYPSPAGMLGVRLPLSTASLELDALAPESPTETVPSVRGGTTLGEEKSSLGPASWANLATSLRATEAREGSLGTEVLPSASPGEETGPAWKEGISPTAEPSTRVHGVDASSAFFPPHAPSLPTSSVPQSRDAKTRHGIPFPHSWASVSTSEAIPSTEVTVFGSSGEQGQSEVHGTGQIVATAMTVSVSASKLPYGGDATPTDASKLPHGASGAATPTDAPSVLTSAMLGLRPAWPHFAVASTTPSPSSPSSTFPAPLRTTDSKLPSEPKAWAMSLPTEGAGSTPVAPSTARSEATVPPLSPDLTGVVQPVWTTGAGKQQGDLLTGSTASGLFSRAPSEWGHAPSTLLQAVVDGTEATGPSSAVDTSVALFAPSAGDRGSSKVPADLSLVEARSTRTTHPVVSLSSHATALPASSRTQASVLTTRAACTDIPCLNNGLPASFTPLQRTSAPLPVTSQTLPQKFLVTTLGSTVGKKGAGPSTKRSDPRVTHTTALASMEPGTATGGGPTSTGLGSTPRASVVGRTTQGDVVSLGKQALDVHILSLQFHLVRVDYTESLEDKSSARYQKLEREVVLTLNKVLSSYESFLQATVLRFLHGSVVAQSEATFRGEGPIPTPSDLIRTIVTAVEQREMDAFFDWRLDLKSVRCNGFTLKNLEPEVLALSFTVLGWGSIAVFGGLTDWGPLEGLRNEVVLSLEARYRVQNFSLVQVRNMQGDLDVSGDLYVDTEPHVDVGWALEALKGLVNHSVHLGSICINGSRLPLQIFPISFSVTNRLFSEKLLDRSSAAHQSLSWDLSRVLTRMLGQYKNLQQVTIREIRGGSLICHGDVIFTPPAPTSKDIVQTLALSVGPKRYLGASNIQVDPFSFRVAGAKLEPPSADRNIPGYGITLIVLSCLAVVVMPLVVLLHNALRRKDKLVIHRVRDPEAVVEMFEMDNPGFRSLAEDNGGQLCPPTEVLG